MGSVLVVMGHEHLKNTLEVLLIQNQHPVETFRASRAHKPLGVPTRNSGCLPIRTSRLGI